MLRNLYRQIPKNQKSKNHQNQKYIIKVTKIIFYKYKIYFMYASRIIKEFLDKLLINNIL